MWVEIIMLIVVALCIGLATTAGTIAGFLMSMALFNRLLHPTVKGDKLEH